MTEDKHNRYALLCRASEVGTGCVSGEEPPQVSSTGSWTASMSSYSRRLGPFLGQLRDGGTVIDKWSVPDPTFTHLVISGPMVAVGLPDGAVDACPEIPDYMVQALGGAFQTLAAVKKAKPKWTGLDRISLRDYTDLWRDAGARIGKRDGDVIRWEDGEVEPIPPIDDYKVWTACDEVTRR